MHRSGVSRQLRIPRVHLRLLGKAWNQWLASMKLREKLALPFLVLVLMAAACGGPAYWSWPASTAPSRRSAT